MLHHLIEMGLRIDKNELIQNEEENKYDDDNVE